MATKQRTPPMHEETRALAQARLKRIAGQVAGLQRMLDEDRCCMDVLTQVSAVQAALLQTARVILSGHVESMLGQSARAKSPGRRQQVDELLGLVSRFYSLDAPRA